MTQTVKDLVLKIATVRFFSTYAGDSNGGIFACHEVKPDGGLDRSTTYVLILKGRDVYTDMEKGQIWQIVRGKAEPTARTVTMKNGKSFNVPETNIYPSSLFMLKPSGDHVIDFLAHGKEFRNIGRKLAERMFNLYGEDLYRILDDKDYNSLITVKGISDETIESLFESWEIWGKGKVVEWLQKRNFPSKWAKRLIDIFGADAIEYVEEDPYRMLSFAQPATGKYKNFRKVDYFAKTEFGITDDDPRRVHAALEEALLARTEETGSTRFLEKEILSEAAAFLNKRDKSTEAFAATFIDSAVERGIIIKRGNFLAYPGAFLMELEVAKYLFENIKVSDQLKSTEDFVDFVLRYQEKHGVTLGEKQIEALAMCNAAKVVTITGGAGTGKTTTQNANFDMLYEEGYELLPVALSGKAARRIFEATKAPSQTIAGFLKRFISDQAPEKAALVIDEASMVDLTSFYQLIRVIPESWRLIIVGDPKQLPPVSFGLILHEIVRSKVAGATHVQLSKVHRYGGEIADAADKIKEDVWPDFDSYSSGDIEFVDCHADELNDTVLRLFNQDRNCQVLSPLNSGENGSASALNAILQQACNSHGVVVTRLGVDAKQHQVGFRVGDTIICSKNHNKEEIYNGSMGVVLDHQKPEPEHPLKCSINWDDGVVREVNETVAQDLNLGYCITIHKSQGSAFPRVIVALPPNRLLDASLLYTAVTRAENQVVLVGDRDSAKNAVEGGSKANSRQVWLGELLDELEVRGAVTAFLEETKA